MKEATASILIKQSQKKRLEHIKLQLSELWGRAATFADALDASWGKS